MYYGNLMEKFGKFVFRAEGSVEGKRTELSQLCLTNVLQQIVKCVLVNLALNHFILVTVTLCPEGTKDLSHSL